MQEVLAQISLGDVVSTLLAGLLTLLAAVFVSRREFNRRAEQKRKNWYRSIHNMCVRVRGSNAVNQQEVDDWRIQRQTRQYEVLADQFQRKLSGTPTEDEELSLFYSIQNVLYACDTYVAEVKSPNDLNRRFLQEAHDEVTRYALVSLYIIEYGIEPNVDFLNELGGKDLEKAKKDYKEWTGRSRVRFVRES